MAVTKETGAGVVGATAYTDPAEVTTYLERFDPDAHADWTALSTNAQEGHCETLSEFLDARYLWKGRAQTEDQGLGLPRERFWDVHGRRWWEPADQVAKAAQAVAKLFPLHFARRVDREVDPGETLVAKKLDVISRTFRPDHQPDRRYRAVDRFLSRFYVPRHRRAVPF